jgi:acyl-CoA reductase-like NAD-dependent aldehyde dehydrogenase
MHDQFAPSHTTVRIHNEEVFGPVMVIIKFETEADVIKMANSTDFGLGCSVFTTNYGEIRGK